MDENFQSPGLIKWILGAVGLGAVTVPLTIPKYGVWISLAILVLLILQVGGYLLWQSWKRKKEQARFANAVEQQSAAAPRGISDPNKRAKLDDLRKRFQEGIGVYESRGKDLYKLPWYVFIGESGSGKTEAIRHSNVGFPPGMQDEFQGAGGTVNMHWWFTNHAVLLDTAGRMMFEEVKTGDSSEWREFLRLLRKTRPHCPVNGLFLVFPVDSLIKDSADKIAQKAGRIAQQLDVIQRSLDIRFPVYVLVTKCDLMTGFREFFDGVEDPQLQHQMMGWSNPDPLDSPFRPDLVDQYLVQVAERLRRRRLGLLRDPVPVDAASTRRTDEVDALFALPQSLLLIAPRLRRYLETIFVAGEWSAKPVFLRGIYFTSSMREGSDLDEALAQALGIPVTDLPGGRVWDKDRAFFLRDLFVEKAFRERGLVTRATNTKSMLRNRQLALFGCGVGALALLLVFSWLGWRNLNQSVLRESGYWQVATNNWDRGTWNPIVRPGIKDPLAFSYVGNDPVMPDRKEKLAEFHAKLKNLVMRPLPISWVFRPIAWTLKKGLDRPAAQKTVFERSVVQPLVENTQIKMTNLNSAASRFDPTDPSKSGRHLAALLSLIRLEAEKMNGKGVLEGTNSTLQAQRYLSSFLNYLTETNQAVDTNLVSTLAWTYSAQGGGKGNWPPKRLSGGDSLAANRPIDRGLDQFLELAKSSQKSQNDWLILLDTMRDLVWEFQRQEERLHKLAANKGPVTDNLLDPLTTTKNNLDSGLVEAKNRNIYKEGVFSLETQYTNLMAQSQLTSRKSFEEIYAAMSIDRPVTQGLFSEIRNKLGNYENKMVSVIEASYRQTTNITVMDRNFLADFKTARLYAFRWSMYASAYNAKQAGITVEELFGREWDPFKKLQDNRRQIDANLSGYSGAYNKELAETCSYLFNEAERYLYQELTDKYLQLATDRCRALSTRNQEQVNLPWLDNAKSFLEKLERDLADSALTRVPADQQSKLRPLRQVVTQAKTSLVQKYVLAQQTKLKENLGFPVTFDDKTTLFAEQLLGLKNTIKNLQKELASPTLSYYPQPLLDPLRNKAAACVPMLQALLDDNNSTRPCKIRVMEPKSDADRNSAGRFREVDLITGTKLGGHFDASSDFLKLVSLSLDQGFTLRVKKFVSDPDSQVVNQGDSFKEWGVLNLIRKYEAQKKVVRVDGKTWNVALPVGDGQKEGVLNFELTFDQPLPPLNEWPRVKDLE